MIYGDAEKALRSRRFPVDSSSGARCRVKRDNKARRSISGSPPRMGIINRTLPLVRLQIKAITNTSGNLLQYIEKLHS